MSYTEHTWVTGELVTATKLNNMESGIKNNETLVTGMRGSIAPEFAANVAYSKGDYVFYEGALYRFTANHAAGAWTGTDVTGTDMGDDVSDISEDCADLKEALTNGKSPLSYSIVPNEYVNKNTGAFISYSGWSRTDYIAVPSGEKIYINNTVSTDYCGFYDANHTRVAGAVVGVGSPYSLDVPDDAVYFVYSNLSTSMFTSISAPLDWIDKTLTQEGEAAEAKATGDAIRKLNVEYDGEFAIGELIPDSYINRSYGDLRPYTGWSATEFLKIGLLKKLVINCSAESESNCFYDATKTLISNFVCGTSSEMTITIPDNAVYIRLSNTDAAMATLKIKGLLGVICEEIEELHDISNKLSNARHVPRLTIKPLTLFHFSDLHGDSTTLARLMQYADENADMIDDIICTGDMVANTYTQIASWWDARVLTVIGNHDAASYNSSTGYDWDALSMANRDAYYIAPFESNWGITHTSGKSYYYKDYTTEKVRLIVLDSQVYVANGQDATDQNTWLANLLSSAITNDYHVLIAIHAPHGGSAVEDCSFSKYGATTMATYADSNTPQVVVDAVSTGITNGLKFIGYIVGHEHQDFIFRPATGQLGYCITCAAITPAASWNKYDQARSIKQDAYNLVTIDTANTLVKIVRGGGADIDDHMRTRKAICFNYSTGDKVGEVL